MAEPVVVNAPLLVIAFDPWGRAVATMISGATDAAVAAFDGDAGDVGSELARRAPTARLAVLVLSGPAPNERTVARVAFARAALEARGVPSMTVERDEHAVYAGPAVVAGQPGCHRCWQARRRQHAGSLPPALAPVVPDDPELCRLAARATLGVARRVIAAPEAEAGVVRRFVPGGRSPLAGRVVPVSGCPRCDPLTPSIAGWSLHAHVTAGMATTTA